MGLSDWWTESSAAWLGELSALAEDRRIELQVGSRVIHGTIRDIELHPAASPQAFGSADGRVDAFDRVSLTLDEVMVGDHPVNEVKVSVDNVRLQAAPNARLQGGPIVVDARLPLDALGPWLTKHHATIEGIDAEAGTLQIRRRWKRMQLVATVIPGVTARAALLTVHRLTVFGRAIRLPSRFDLSLTAELPLHPDMRLLAARLIDDETLEVTGYIAQLDHPISAQEIVDRLRSRTGPAQFTSG